MILNKIVNNTVHTSQNTFKITQRAPPSRSKYRLASNTIGCMTLTEVPMRNYNFCFPYLFTNKKIKTLTKRAGFFYRRENLGLEFISSLYKKSDKYIGFEYSIQSK